MYALVYYDVQVQQLSFTNMNLTFNFRNFLCRCFFFQVSSNLFDAILNILKNGYFAFLLKSIIYIVRSPLAELPSLLVKTE